MLSLASYCGLCQCFDAEKAGALARDCNDFGAEMMRDNPGRFGWVATLTMLGINKTRKDIEYLFGPLIAAGAGLQRNYGDKWLGHDVYRPVFDELNRRKAVVY